MDVYLQDKHQTWATVDTNPEILYERNMIFISCGSMVYHGGSHSNRGNFIWLYIVCFCFIFRITMYFIFLFYYFYMYNIVVKSNKLSMKYKYWYPFILQFQNRSIITEKLTCRVWGSRLDLAFWATFLLFTSSQVKSAVAPRAKSQQVYCSLKSSTGLELINCIIKRKAKPKIKLQWHTRMWKMWLKQFV